MNQCGMGTGHN